MKTKELKFDFSLPPGAMLDMMRCEMSYEKFHGEKCVDMNSRNTLKNKEKITKNKLNTWVPKCNSKQK